MAGTGDGPGKGETPKGDFSCVNFPGRRMKNPVNWDGARVYCAFLFAVSADVLKNQPLAFNTFYRVLANPDVEEKIRRLQADNDLPDEVFRQRLFQIFQILR